MSMMKPSLSMMGLTNMARTSSETPSSNHELAGVNR